MRLSLHGIQLSECNELIAKKDKDLWGRVTP